MDNVGGVFPTAYDPTGELLPTWAIAVVAAAIGVTLLWIVSITLLVVCDVIGGRRSNANSNLYATPQLFHASSQVSLGTPPPPVPAPPCRASSAANLFAKSDLLRRSSRRSERSEVRVNPGFQDSVVSADQSDHELQDKEYTLRLQDDSVSIDSQCSLDSDMVIKKKPAGASVVEGATSVSPHTSLRASPTGSGGSPSHTLSGMVLSRPVTIRQLGATLREPNYIDTEFKKLPTPIVNSDEIPSGVERKNRYTNVLPNPRSRVPLQILPSHPSSDYINANYIRGFKGAFKQYIATQGPLENTVEDFWRMVWENNSEIIVMATNFQERGIDKCSRYWPAQGSEQYGSIEVTLLSQTSQPTYNHSKLQIRLLVGGSKSSRCVDHYRLTVWPYQGVPKETSIVTDFLKEVKMADTNGPVVVHCSAGIGRTALLIAVDIGLQGILQGEAKVDVLRIVSTMRQDRAGSVQTRDQYKFIHQCLYDFARFSMK